MATIQLGAIPRRGFGQVSVDNPGSPMPIPGWLAWVAARIHQLISPRPLSKLPNRRTFSVPAASGPGPIPNPRNAQTWYPFAF